jgi:hypothetical protein
LEKEAPQSPPKEGMFGTIDAYVGEIYAYVGKIYAYIVQPFGLRVKGNAFKPPMKRSNWGLLGAIHLEIRYTP